MQLPVMSALMAGGRQTPCLESIAVKSLLRKEDCHSLPGKNRLLVFLSRETNRLGVQNPLQGPLPCNGHRDGGNRCSLPHEHAARTTTVQPMNATGVTVRALHRFGKVLCIRA